MAWAPDYVTVEELKAYVSGGVIDDTDDDVALALAVTAASRAIDHATNRQFGVVASAEERIYSALPDYERGLWFVPVDDYQTDTNLAVTVDGTAVTTFDKEPRNATQEGRPWTRVVFTEDSEAQPCSDSEIAVTAVWGWTGVPDTIVQATLLQANRVFTRRNAPFGVAGSPDAGSEMRLLAKVDADVEVMVRAYRRVRAVW